MAIMLSYVFISVLLCARFVLHVGKSLANRFLKHDTIVSASIPNSDNVLAFELMNGLSRYMFHSCVDDCADDENRIGGPALQMKYTVINIFAYIILDICSITRLCYFYRVDIIASVC